ncbi:MAG: RDD family protein [Pseudonocardia sp.]|nr:RDD family protein [Pseudonocardia sp.]
MAACARRRSRRYPYRTTPWPGTLAPVSDLVTGDAVVLDLRLAKLPSRALAFGIDLIVMLTTLAILVGIVFSTLPSFDQALAAAAGLAMVIIVFVAYPVTVETLTRGRSLGKLALGLRVVRDDGGPIMFRHAFTRGLAGLVVDFGVFSGFTGAVAVIASLASARGKRVGDVLAGTVVVRDRLPPPEVLNLQMPAPLAGWAPSLELSRLPDPLALRVRQFLSRVHELDPAHRVALGASLADEVSAHVSPPAPAGTPAEAYLTAVLLTRRGREETVRATRAPTDAPPCPTIPPLAPPKPPEEPPPPGSDGFVVPH